MPCWAVGWSCLLLKTPCFPDAVSLLTERMCLPSGCFALSVNVAKQFLRKACSSVDRASHSENVKLLPIFVAHFTALARHQCRDTISSLNVQVLLL